MTTAKTMAKMMPPMPPRMAPTTNSNADMTIIKKNVLTVFIANKTSRLRDWQNPAKLSKL
jgi:hypothetical protein